VRPNTNDSDSSMIYDAIGCL